MSAVNGRYWIVETNGDGKRCRVFLRHGDNPDGYFMAEYTGYFDYKLNRVKLYRRRFSVNGVPREDSVSIFDLRTEPKAPPKKNEKAEVNPIKTVRHRPAPCPGQILIDNT